MTRLHGERPFEEEQYERQGGVLVPVNGGHEVGCQDDLCAPDELVEDPLNDDGVPGTPDDLPYDYGVEVPNATDQQVLSPEHRHAGFGGLGATGAPADPSQEPPLGAADERDLWNRQRGLIQESGDEAARWGALSEESLPRVEDAVGDDAGEVLPDAPEGESATGSS
jgi:hypothetical protein